MDTDLNPILAAVALLVVIPMLLWAEAFFRGPRWFRVLTNVLIVLWMLPLAANALTETVCSGGWYNGYGNCLGPLDAELYNKHLLLFPLMPISLAVYLGAIVARALEAIMRKGRTK